jgi:hypothetical protein
MAPTSSCGTIYMALPSGTLLGLTTTAAVSALPPASAHATNTPLSLTGLGPSRNMEGTSCSTRLAPAVFYAYGDAPLRPAGGVEQAFRSGTMAIGSWPLIETGDLHSFAPVSQQRPSAALEASLGGGIAEAPSRRRSPALCCHGSDAIAGDAHIGPGLPSSGHHQIACKGKRFFIAEDDPDLRELVEDLVAFKDGVVGVSIADPIEALDVPTFQLGPVDVAVVDYDYRGSPYTGLDLIRFLREKGVKEIYLFTNSLLTVTGLREAALDAGATAVTPKTTGHVFI